MKKAVNLHENSCTGIFRLCGPSVAIAEDGKLLGEAFLNTGLTHSQTLLPLVHGLLKNANLALDEIDAFAVTNGPGSFTGVRIGVAAIKGLAFPHDKPVSPSLRWK